MSQSENWDIFCRNNPSDWSNHISTTEFTHNHCSHSVTGKSPFFLIYRYDLKPLPDLVIRSPLPTVKDRISNLENSRKEGLARYEIAWQTMKSCIYSKFTPFWVRDKVWLEVRNLKCKIQDPKFAPKREGSFTIEKVLSSLSYKLCIPETWKIHPIFYTSLLTLYHENEVHSLNFPNPPPDLISNEEEYEIKKIICHHGPPRNQFYLIRWKGYSAEDNQWILESNLRNAPEILSSYKSHLHLA